MNKLQHFINNFFIDYWFCIKCHKYIEGNLVPESCKNHLLERINSETYHLCVGVKK
jgi:hypothetical protein